MHKLIEQKLKEYQEIIERTMSMEDDILEVERIMPNADIFIDYEVNINLRVKSMDEVKEALRLFASEGHLLDSYTYSDSLPLWRLHGKNVPIVLIVYFPFEGEEEAKGATCRRVKIGEDTAPRPIYKIVCDKPEDLEATQ